MCRVYRYSCCNKGYITALVTLIVEFVKSSYLGLTRIQTSIIRPPLNNLLATIWVLLRQQPIKSLDPWPHSSSTLFWVPKTVICILASEQVSSTINFMAYKAVFLVGVATLHLRSFVVYILQSIVSCITGNKRGDQERNHYF